MSKHQMSTTAETEGSATSDRDGTLADIIREACVEGDRGKPRDVPVDDIKVDFSYQRQEVSKAGTLWRARNFSWIAFGTIILMQRSNGALYVVDGYQRLLAALRRGNIKTVPARVFISRGPAAEAAAFIALNVWRRPVSALQKFHTLVKAKSEPETSVLAWLESLSPPLAVVKEETANALNFPTILVNYWKQDAEASMEAVRFQVRLNHNLDQPLHNYLHKGFWYLFHFGLPLWDYLDKLESRGGKNAIIQAIAGRMLHKSKKSASERMCGLAVLDVINVRCKNKVGKALYRDEEEFEICA